MSTQAEATKKETLIMTRPDSMYEMSNHYCPGCGHGIIHNMLGEVIDECGIVENTILVAPVGCAVMAFLYFKMDGCEAPHGRIPAVATGIRRVHPDKMVIAYQGDGDLLAIGMAETVHAANRGENITVIFVNNVNYGMTGGQMAPTTLVGQKTKTTPSGRDPGNDGYPIRACELLNTLEAPVFIERCSVHNIASILKTKRAIKKGIQYQMGKKGYSFIEVLSTCPTNWGMTPVDSMKWLENEMIPYFPLGNFRDRGV